MKKINKIAAVITAFTGLAVLGGCAQKGADTEKENAGGGTEIFQPLPPEELPETKTVTYARLTADGVNIRSGAGTGYRVLGAAEKSTLYAVDGEADGWLKTGYKNATAYISAKYCDAVEMPQSDDERIERVIAEGAKLLGTPYVFGAARYHNGNGVKDGNFDINAFDCSSLMQYIFFKGAGVNLQVTSRTQSAQGATVPKDGIERGDLLFFTNSSRQSFTGIERIGHVALYLGGNYILHTASDYAKIESISAARWGYFIKAQRVI